MNSLTLKAEHLHDYTTIDNLFIDHYMCDANGEFVKVYLYLLRIARQVPQDFSLLLIADRMNLTERDVLRALKYWEQKNLLSLQEDESGTVTALTLKHLTSAGTASPVPLSESASSSTPELSMEVQQLVLLAEQYFKRQLTPLDLEKILYFYEQLHFSYDLIEYLFDHCATAGNCTTRYVESVAASWAGKGVTTVEEAKALGQAYRREYYAILKAYGIQNRSAVDSELQYMQKWLDQYHFSVDVICEACSRTVASTGKPAFHYTDSILSKWKEKGIRTKKDIAALDSLHYQKQKKAAQTDSATERTSRQPQNSGTKFSNFEQRTTYDYDLLEKELNLT